MFKTYSATVAQQNVTSKKKSCAERRCPAPITRNNFKQLTYKREPNKSLGLADITSDTKSFKGIGNKVWMFIHSPKTRYMYQNGLKVPQ